MSSIPKKSGFYVFEVDKKLFIGLWNEHYEEMHGVGTTFYIDEIDKIICGPFQIEDLLTKFPKYEEKLCLNLD